jgi:predicted Zn-dependent peptidase
MVKIRTLENGIPVIMEKIKGMRSACVGIWVKVGSRYESPKNNGISHFLEHMFFKGTKRRTQKEIAVEIDSVGGDLNAYTSRETTTFYVKVLSDFTAGGIDLLADIFKNSQLRDEDVEIEKEVVEEEIKMVEDTPDEHVHDYFYTDIWDETGLGMPILGNLDTVRSFTQKDLLDYTMKNYGAGDVVISCAGNIEPDAVLGLLSEHLGGIPAGGGASDRTTVRQAFRPGLRVYEKDLSDVHICIGVEGIKQDSVLRYPFLILNTIFGAGVSSRLFQEVRENRGLSYSIYSFLSSYHDVGVFGVYAAAGKNKYVKVLETVFEEMKKLRDTITASDLERAKCNLKGNIMLALESTHGRMNNLARQIIYYDRYYSPAQIIRGIDRVKMKDIRGVVDDYILTGKTAVTLLGPAEEKKVRGMIP